MANLECPHCHKPTIPAWRKMMIGPVTSATCRECGGKVSVPWSAMWTLIPFLAAILITPYFKSNELSVVLWVAGAMVMGLLYHFFVPLIARR
jgi:hypothetical protein